MVSGSNVGKNKEPALSSCQGLDLLSRFKEELQSQGGPVSIQQLGQSSSSPHRHVGPSASKLSRDQTEVGHLFIQHDPYLSKNGAWC